MFYLNMWADYVPKCIILIDIQKESSPYEHPLDLYDVFEQRIHLI